MKNTYIALIILLTMVSSLFSCQKITEESLTETLQLLKVKARTSVDAKLDYPLYLYAFDKNGTCSATQVIQQSTDSIGLKLVPGEYRIVAISNLSEEYILPEKPNALEEITLQSTHGATTAMMMGKADITISSKTTSLNLTLTHAVTSISTILSGIPEDATAVQITLSPMYGAICMNGEYARENQKIEIPCQLKSDQTWHASPVYAFPGSGEQTIFSIQITQKDQTQNTYAYTYGGKPEANRPFNISGNYTGSVMVGGDFIVEGWGSSIDVEFDFGGISVDNNQNNNPNFDGSATIGNIWDNGIIAGDDGKRIFLMSLDEWTCYADDLAELLEEYAVNGWLLPNEEQARALNNTFQDESLDSLNETLEAEGYPIINIDKRYLYDNDGEIYAFGFKPTSKFLKAGTQTKYRVRLVKYVSQSNP